MKDFISKLNPGKLKLVVDNTKKVVAQNKDFVSAIGDIWMEMFTIGLKSFDDKDKDDENER